MIDIIVAAKMGSIFHLKGKPKKPKIVELASGSNNVKNSVHSINFFNDLAITGTGYSSLKVWQREPNKWKTIKTIDLPYVPDTRLNETYAVSIDDKYLYAGTESGLVEIRDLHQDFKVVHEIRDFNSEIFGLTVDNNGIFIQDQEGFFNVYNKQFEKIFSAKHESYGNPTPPANMISIHDQIVCIPLYKGFILYNWDGRSITKTGEFRAKEDWAVNTAIYGDKCYWASWNGWVREFALGKKITGSWEKQIGEGSLTCINLDEDYVYVGTYFGNLVCFARDGMKKIKSIRLDKEIEVIALNKEF